MSSQRTTASVLPASAARFETLRAKGVEVLSTCPQSKDADAETYLEESLRVARWSDEAGCSAMLVYTDNGLVDPWLLSQQVLEATTQLCPLIAIQPVYMHPYT
ncbi:alkanesulfonate monooxygenase, partial [Actinomadura sp. DSM 109109]|nr:alkanesulfonate monooxygenase [Actinomadura lepetitiana]